MAENHRDLPLRIDRARLPEPEWTFSNAKITTFASCGTGCSDVGAPTI